MPIKEGQRGAEEGMIIPETSDDKSPSPTYYGETYPNIYSEVGEETIAGGTEVGRDGKYTNFWGGRSGYAIAQGHLSPEEATRLCKESGFTQWAKREAVYYEDAEE
jgi:hypothetical protein